MKKFILPILSVTALFACEAKEADEENNTEAEIEIITPEEKEEMGIKEEVSSTPIADVKTAGAEYRAANGEKEGVVTLENGLQYEVLTEGTGAMPTMENSVTVHYHGTSIEGKVFDSSVDRNEPFTHNMTDPLIKGWVQAELLMTEGAKWRVTMPSELAYGAGGSPPVIAPFETLIFEIELISINN